MLQPGTSSKQPMDDITIVAGLSGQESAARISTALANVESAEGTRSSSTPRKSNATSSQADVTKAPAADDSPDKPASRPLPTINIVTPASTPEEKQHVREVCVTMIFVLTDDLLDTAGDFLDEMIDMASARPDPLLLNVCCNVREDRIPEKLRNHPVLNYDDEDFQTNLMEKVQAWCSAVAHDADDADNTDAPEQMKTIIEKLIFEIIEKKVFTEYDFYKKLLEYRDKVNLQDIHSDGLNPLHVIIINNRLNLMLTLVHVKLFRVYYAEVVPVQSSSVYRGHTACQIAESKSARRYREELAKMNELERSKSKFLQACHDGDQSLVRLMLEAPMTSYQHSARHLIQEKDSCSNNCLYWVLVSNNLELFLFLLGYNAEYGYVNEKKESLLHVACMLGHHKFIPVLMTQCQLSASTECSGKRTPLERVAENGDIDSVKELLQQGVTLTSSVLPYAALNGRLPFVRYVFEETTQYVHIDSRDSTGRSSLMKACETGRQDVVEYLLKKGASVSVEDLRRRTPLHVAAENGHVDIMKMLLDNGGAQLDAQDHYIGAELCFLIRGKDQGRKAWHYVEVRRSVVQIFLQKTKNGQVDVATYGTVVKSGWGQDPDKSVSTAIEKLFSERRSRAADPDMTALHMAIYKQHTDAASLLIERGADIHKKDKFGLTPFMMCAMRGDKQTAMLLESRGARMTDRDMQGWTALQIAERNNQAEIMRYINGNSMIPVVEKYVDCLEKLAQELSQEHLDGMRRQGTDVRTYIVDKIREATIDNNQLLMSVGSGPVMKVSGADASGAAAMTFPTRASDSGLGASYMPSSAGPQASSFPVRATQP